MNKKLLIISSSILGSAIIVAGGAGITYQTKWTHFKKDFANVVKKQVALINASDPNTTTLTYKLDNTKAWSVTYIITHINYSDKSKSTHFNLNEHYHPFGKFSIDDLAGPGQDLLFG